MASSTQPYGKLLDYEQYIDHQLGRTRARIKMTDLSTAALLLVATTLGVLFLEVVLDHVFGLPLWLRRIVFLGGLGASGAFVFLRVLMPLVSKVNGFYAARTIEEADPKFKNSLINYLTTSGAPAERYSQVRHGRDRGEGGEGPGRRRDR